MRQVTVRGSLVHVSGDPHRVLTQLLDCVRELASPREAEARFASGGEGFSLEKIVDARPSAKSTAPYRAPQEGVSEPWTVTMHRAKGKPRVVVLDGEELRHLVHAALYPPTTAVGERNRQQGYVIFGVGGAVFVGCTLLMHQAADWFLAVPFGLMMGIVTGIRLARRYA